VKVSTEKLENSQIILNIEIEPPELEKSLKEAYHRLVGSVHVPGFRKGKAPRAILENFIGEENLKGEALESLIPQLYNQAIEEQQIEPLTQPEVEIVQKEPVILKATVSLRPNIELGDYHCISLSPEPVEITDEQVDSAIEQLRDQHATWEPVERPVQFEDLVTIDIEELDENGPGKKFSGQQLRVIEGSQFPLPNFVDQLVGMEPGQEKEVALSYPDDFELKDLAGIERRYKVNLSEVKEKNLPELNDEFVKNLNEDIDSLATLRERLYDNLKTMSENKAQRDFEEKAVQSLIDISKLEFPPIIVEEEIDRILNERQETFGGGQRGLDNFLTSIGKTEEEARDEIRPLATERVKRMLALGKLLEEENIKVDAAEIDSEIKEILEHSTKENDEVKKILGTPQGRSWIEQTLLSRKTVQHLLDMVSGNATKVEEEGNDVDAA
jgi:trigger factor